MAEPRVNIDRALENDETFGAVVDEIRAQREREGLNPDTGKPLDAQSSHTTSESEAEERFLHPIATVYFRAGLLACREYMARFVEQGGDKNIADSIRANWWPSLGRDFGRPRKIEWNEVTEGEYGTESFRVKTKDEVSPTLEALPVAMQFLLLHGGFSYDQQTDALSDETNHGDTP